MYFRFFIYSQILICAQTFTQHCHQATGRCFWISDTSQGMWEEGRTACQSEGGDLAVMETEELYDFVVSTFRWVQLIHNKMNFSWFFAYGRLTGYAGERQKSLPIRGRRSRCHGNRRIVQLSYK